MSKWFAVAFAVLAASTAAPSVERPRISIAQFTFGPSTLTVPAGRR